MNLFLRRVASAFYDGILVLSLLLTGSLIFLLMTRGNTVSPSNYAYKAFVWLIIAAFYVGFWWRTGQTLGMRAWKLKVVSLRGEKLSFNTASLRFFYGFFSMILGGLGWIWILFDSEQQALYDRLAKTKLITIHKK